MPKLLNTTTIRLIEASIENLSLSIESLQKPKRIPIHDDSSFYSVSMGLLGISFELLCNALIVQTYGEKKLILPSGFYKTAKQVYSELIEVLRNPIPKISFLTQGVEKPSDHIHEFITDLSHFSFITTLRANSVHFAKAPNRDIIKVYINKLIRIYQLLSKSSKIAGYLNYIPNIIADEKSNHIILEELVKKIESSKVIDEKANSVLSLFLVLPDLPKESPEWIEKIERVSITPRESDIQFLLSIVNRCESVSLIKNTSGKNSISVVIKPDDPNAIPIDPHYIKKSLTKEREQFYANIGMANGRLELKKLDLPPSDFVLDLFVNGLEGIDDKYLTNPMTPSESWSFIISSLSMNGTVGPYWFLIRKTDDKSQLNAILKRAIPLGNGWLKRNERSEELFSGLNSLISGRPIDNSAFAEINTDIKRIDELKEKLPQSLKITLLESYEPYRSLIEEVANESKPVGSLITELLSENNVSSTIKITVARHLINVANSDEDVKPLYSLLTNTDYKALKSNIRKAMRIIDYIYNGPSVI